MSEWAKKLCRTLGLSYVWWHWKWLNFKKRWKEFFSTDKNTVRLALGLVLCFVLLPGVL